MFLETKTAHDEEEITINTDHIVLITFYPDSNMSRIDTVVKGLPIWVDGNFNDAMRRSIMSNLA